VIEPPRFTEGPVVLCWTSIVDAVIFLKILMKAVDNDVAKADVDMFILESVVSVL
jgi:hypothetical protein